MVVTRDRSSEARATGGFLDLQRLDIVLEYPDGTASQPFSYDAATRKALDAVVIVAHFVEAAERHVYLRSAVRPPCALRTQEPKHDGGLWELPAGLIEPGEEPAACAARELLEELGCTAAPSAMKTLGHWTFPAAGLIGSRHLYFAVEIDPRLREMPHGDGSPLELGAAIVAVPLAAALYHCTTGAILDEKTELGLRRFAEIA
jgi:ADP-ribose pyrophosphatase